MGGALPVVEVGKRGEERLRAGHLWVFGDELRAVPVALQPGEWVSVRSRAGEPLGTGTLNLSCRIALRVVSRGDVLPCRAFFASRIAAAWERRCDAGLAEAAALRLVYSEGDFLPGLVADRYGGVIVVQVLTAGMEGIKDEIVSVLAERFRPRLIYERSGGAGRKMEGLAERRGILFGEGPPVEEVEIDGVRFRVDVEGGPKTGFFLDHGRNRLLVRDWARGRAVLDGFCATGAFGLFALHGGAARVLAIDARPAFLEAARENAALNGFAGRWEGRAADMFTALRDLAASGSRFDLVILDPPAFAKSREGVEGALRGYRDINRLALALLSEGGLLATASCTQAVDVAKWKEAIRAAAADAGVDLEIVAAGGQPPDHPVLLGVPETEYLKFALFRKRTS